MKRLPLLALTILVPALGAASARADDLAPWHGAGGRGPRDDGRGGHDRRDDDRGGRDANGHGGYGRHGGLRRLPRMPDLARVPLAEAQALLAERGVSVHVEQRTVPEAQLGVVLAQQPAVGTPLLPGSVAVLSVARAARVPALTGRLLPEARRLAHRAGLRLELEEPRREPAFGLHGMHGDARRPDLHLPEELLTVETQSRLAGAVIAEGSLLRVRVRRLPVAFGSPGRGPGGWGRGGFGPGGFGPGGFGPGAATPAPQPLVTVPEVTGQLLSEARARLEALGLRVEVLGARDGRPLALDDPRLAWARVAAQDVRAGTAAAVGAQVRLTLAARER